jgi:hypothetical protein
LLPGEDGSIEIRGESTSSIFKTRCGFEYKGEDFIVFSQKGWGEYVYTYLARDGYEWQKTSPFPLVDIPALIQEAQENLVLKRNQDRVNKIMGDPGLLDFSLYKDTMINVQDSLDVGNCASGTDEFVKRFGLDPEHSYTIGMLLEEKNWEEMKKNSQFLRVLLSRIVREGKAL